MLRFSFRYFVETLIFFEGAMFYAEFRNEVRGNWNLNGIFCYTVRFNWNIELGNENFCGWGFHVFVFENFLLMECLFGGILLDLSVELELWRELISFEDTLYEFYSNFCLKMKFWRVFKSQAWIGSEIVSFGGIFFKFLFEFSIQNCYGSINSLADLFSCRTSIKHPNKNLWHSVQHIKISILKSLQ